MKDERHGNSGKMEALRKNIWKPKKGARTVLYFVKKDAHIKQSASINNNKGKNHQNKAMLMLLVKNLSQMMMES